ncbi:MAG: MFS transporter [Ruminiclostridium sp.]
MKIDIKKDRIIKKNIFSLLAAQMISLLGSSIYSFAMGLYVLAYTGSGFNYALTIVVGVLPGIIWGPIAGVLADRFDKKKIIIWTDFISAIILGIIWILFEKNGFHLSYIYISDFLLATCCAFAETPVQASMPKLVDNVRLTKINSLCQAVSSISSIAGPGIGGLLFAIFDIKMFLVFNAVSFLVATFLDSLLNLHVNDNNTEIDENAKTESSDKKEQGSFMQDFKDGFKYIKSQNWLLILGGFTVFFNMFCTIGLIVAVPVIAVNVWKMTSVQVGVLQAMFPFGTLLGSLVMYVLPQPNKYYKRIITCITSASIIMFLIGILSCDKLVFTQNFYYYCIIVLLIAFAVCSVSYNIPFSVSLQKNIPEEILGRVRGIIFMFVNALSPVGALIGGILIDIISPWTLPLVCGIIMIILSIAMLRVKSLKSI